MKNESSYCNATQHPSQRFVNEAVGVGEHQNPVAHNHLGTILFSSLADSDDEPMFPGSV